VDSYRIPPPHACERRGKGKRYVGSAVELSKRLYGYYSKAKISNSKGNSYIYNAIINYGYSAFSLSILRYIEIKGLSNEETKKIILEQEQFYIDSLMPEYNIQKIAGSSLGQKRSEERKT
jgi:group I intron endonuclease